MESVRYFGAESEPNSLNRATPSVLQITFAVGLFFASCVPHAVDKTDNDGDGILDRYETTSTDVGCSYDGIMGWVTSANNSDSDGDGVSDKDDEYPCHPDTDGDGILDYDELERGLDPTRVDTDRDGLSDGIDRRPTTPDADGDGLLDGAEVDLGTDPYESDTDSDGVDDGTEASRKDLDPLNPDTDGDGVLDSCEG